MSCTWSKSTRILPSLVLHIVVFFALSMFAREKEPRDYYCLYKLFVVNQQWPQHDLDKERNEQLLQEIQRKWSHGRRRLTRGFPYKEVEWCCTTLLPFDVVSWMHKEFLNPLISYQNGQKYYSTLSSRENPMPTHIYILLLGNCTPTQTNHSCEEGSFTTEQEAIQTYDMCTYKDTDLQVIELDTRSDQSEVTDIHTKKHTRLTFLLLANWRTHIYICSFILL